MSLKDRIKSVRESEKLSLSAIASLFGETKDKMYSIESGRQKTPAYILQRMVNEFGVDAHWLLTGEGQMYRADQPKADQATPLPTQATLIENQRKARLTAFLDHWFESESSDEHAWLEGQLKRCIPEYNTFITDSKDDSKSQKQQG